MLCMHVIARHWLKLLRTITDEFDASNVNKVLMSHFAFGQGQFLTVKGKFNAGTEELNKFRYCGGCFF